MTICQTMTSASKAMNNLRPHSRRLSNPTDAVTKSRFCTTNSTASQGSHSSAIDKNADACGSSASCSCILENKPARPAARNITACSASMSRPRPARQRVIQAVAFTNEERGTGGSGGGMAGVFIV